MEVRHDIAQQQIVHMTGAEDALDRQPHILDVQRVVGKLVGGKISEGGDVPTPKDHGCVTVRDRVPFKNRLAGSAAMERTGG